jgi:uncharacterized protein (TIGR02145 family)
MKMIYVTILLLVFGSVSLLQSGVTLKIYDADGSSLGEYQSGDVRSLEFNDPDDVYKVYLYGGGEEQASQFLTDIDSVKFVGSNAMLLYRAGVSHSYSILELDSVVFRRNSLPEYTRVRIGDQVWMTKNLDVTHYRNGDEIPQVTDPDEWTELTTGAWCYYDNDEDNNETYGKLYNWYAVNDPRGLAPEGWHVPSDEEWDELEDYLQANEEYWCNENSSYMAKSLASTDLWGSTSNTCAVGNDLTANNATGFTGRPGGYRQFNNGFFYYIGNRGYWWSSTEYSSTSAIYRRLGDYYSGVVRYYVYKSYGFSVRCVRD